LIAWTPLEFDPGADRYLTFAPDAAFGSWKAHRVPGQRTLRPLLAPRTGRFDSLLVEPGPPAVLTDDGIVLIYNGASLLAGADGIPTGVTYQPGQALFDACEPGAPIGRSIDPDVVEDTAGDLAGQLDNVCFAQGLVLHDDAWRMYYGTADSRIGCATAPLRRS
jgi:predicted GH43/DUF377 family glycosyl hydrolase